MAKSTLEMVLEPLNQRDGARFVDRAFPVVSVLLAQSDEIKRLMAKELLADTRYDGLIV